MDIQELYKKAESLENVRVSRLKKAYEFAEKAHAGQYRMSGEPYITHPVSVALLLADYGADEDSLVAALLHDVVEDTGYSLKDIEKNFSKEIEKLVDALTKLPSSSFFRDGRSDKSYLFDTKVESLRKIFEVMQTDVRVIIIKLCDRLHNMSTLFHFRTDKQKRIAQETYDIYVHIAERLSLGDLAQKLKNLSAQYLFPLRYQKFQERVLQVKNEFLAQREAFEKSFSPFLNKKIQSGLIIGVDPRTSDDFFSQELDQISIVPLVTLLVENREECFDRLLKIHEVFQHHRGSIRDYISAPLSNGYRALHTVLHEEHGRVFELRIMTPEMLNYSRNGVTLRCFKTQPRGRKLQLPWVEHLKHIHKNTKDHSREYISALENDILKGSIIVYSDNNRKVLMPPDCTALDVAFYFYGEKAFSLSYITRENTEILFSSRVNDGDTLQFHFSQHIQIDHHWLKYILTSYSRSLVFQYLSKLTMKAKLQIGEELIQMKLSESNLGYLDEISSLRKQSVSSLFHKKDWKELLMDVVHGATDVDSVVLALFERELHQSELVSYEVLIKRNPLPDSFCKICHFLKESDVDFSHIGTETFEDSAVDKMILKVNLREKERIFSFLRDYLKFQVQEVQLFQKGYIPFLSGLLLALFWAVNPFVVRFLYKGGMQVNEVTWLRFVSSAFSLFIIVWVLGRFKNTSFSKVKISFSFLMLVGILVLYSFLLNLSLSYVPSIYYLVPASISFLIISQYHSLAPLKTFYKNSPRLFLIFFCTLLSSLSVALLYLPSEQSIRHGVLIAIAVLGLHILYNFFGNRFQKAHKIQSRGIYMLALSFTFASLFFFPFVNFYHLFELPGYLIAIAILNGFLTGGLAHYFFFEMTQKLQHYKQTLSISFMVFVTFVLGIALEGTSSFTVFLSSLSLIVALILSSLAEYRVQGKYDFIN